ncbi:hypothetical protein [Desulfitobacterium chlororespirans]|uniref:Uncharacterized protein n=1 Tax=Desulfitobacterium chlororespirans DSM 11544 TaxID=1121395 RepID=A0A1M7T5B3_9FIRM|nr:hypothetical protein [Desulfitobacterium chlororespirans]SHN65940.1 hypothetical protein SAMN02745215_01596 [Desulfitobacterium chlororespirans DSM 11544]
MAKKDELIEKVYSKLQILQSKQFTAQQRDVLEALLQDGASYTKSEVISISEDFRTKEAK